MSAGSFLTSAAKAVTFGQSSVPRVSSTFSSATSDRPRPQPARIAMIAPSRLPRIVFASGVCLSTFTCSALSQFPRRPPIRFAPLTRRMPAANCGLSSPMSAAAYTRRRTAARRRLIGEEDNRMATSSSRYHGTTVLLNASRGSEQHHEAYSRPHSSQNRDPGGAALASVSVWLSCASYTIGPKTRLSESTLAGAGSQKHRFAGSSLNAGHHERVIGFCSRGELRGIPEHPSGRLMYNFCERCSSRRNASPGVRFSVAAAQRLHCLFLIQWCPPARLLRATAHTRSSHLSRLYPAVLLSSDLNETTGSSLPELVRKPRALPRCPRGRRSDVNSALRHGTDILNS